MPHAKSLPALDQLLTWSLDRPVTRPARYLIATLVIAVVAVFRASAITSILPWLLFIPPILLIALMLGRGPGIYASVLAMVAAAASIGRPDNAFWLTEVQWVASVIFLMIALGVALLAADVRAAFERARRLTAEKDHALQRLADRESFLTSVLASSTDCIKILDLDARLTFMSEGGKEVMEVSDFNAIHGCPWPDFWEGQGNADAKAAVAMAKAGQSSSFIGKASTMAGNERWWHVAVSPVVGTDGTPSSILSVSRDITAMRAAEAESSRLTRIVENSKDFIAVIGLDGSVSFVNDAGLAMVGVDRSQVASMNIADFFAAEDADAIHAELLPAVDRDGSWAGERQLRHWPTDEAIPVLCTIFPIVDPDGSALGYATVTRDNRGQHQARRQQELLNDELSHRLKNVMAVVQSVASQTLRQATDLRSANEALGARLTALSQATDVLTAKSWMEADLHEVIGRTLAPHGVGDRLDLHGPAITLKPQVTMAFALALHELATNACKYGALSVENGRVALSWQVSDGASAEEPRFQLEWREQGGPPVARPDRHGFGSRMIEQSLRAYFQGDALLDFEPTGLIFTLNAPLAEAGRLRD